MSSEELRAELAEAKRIGRWLYEHLDPEARNAIGDISAWPWLVEDDHQVRPTARPHSSTRTIRVTREQKAKVLRDAARNSKVRFLGVTPGQRRAAERLRQQERP